MEINFTFDLKLSEEERKQQELNNPDYKHIKYVSNNIKVLKVQSVDYIVKNEYDEYFKIIYREDVNGRSLFTVEKVKQPIMQRLLKKLYNCYDSRNCTY